MFTPSEASNVSVAGFVGSTGADVSRLQALTDNAASNSRRRFMIRGLDVGITVVNLWSCTPRSDIGPVRVAKDWFRVLLHPNSRKRAACRRRPATGGQREQRVAVGRNREARERHAIRR